MGKSRPADKGKRKGSPCTLTHAPDSYLEQLSEFSQLLLERGLFTYTDAVANITCNCYFLGTVGTFPGVQRGK